MKKKLPPAKTPLPKFHSDEEAADYFETHSLADVWHQLAAAKPAKPSVRCQSQFGNAMPRQSSVGYRTQLRTCIAEEIRREAKRT
jgi:hypothetical protein